MAFHENIFNLNQPDHYTCYVDRYQSSFDTLCVRAERIKNIKSALQENVLEFVFTDVLYFSGPLTWTGANVCIASRSDCLNVCYRGRIFDKNTSKPQIEDTLNTYNLFMILATEGVEIRLVAHHQDFMLNVTG